MRIEAFSEVASTDRLSSPIRSSACIVLYTGDILRFNEFYFYNRIMNASEIQNYYTNTKNFGVSKIRLIWL